MAISTSEDVTALMALCSVHVLCSASPQVRARQTESVVPVEVVTQDGEAQKVLCWKRNYKIFHIYRMTRAINERTNNLE